MNEELSYLSYKEAEVYGVKKQIMIIQVTESSDLKCVKEKINIGKPLNVR